MKKGIDVSTYQGIIDWETVKPQIDFAIIRCGFGADLNGQDDNRYVRNADECTRLNIPFGVYLYSYAQTVEEAKMEAEHTLRLIEAYQLEYPVYYDVEDTIQENLSNQQLTEICKAYCSEIEKAGYYVGIYSNLYWLENKLNSEELDVYDKWVAQWNVTDDYKKAHGMWQYSNQGQIDGIEGRVDLDISYYDFPVLLTERGLNRLSKDDIPTEVPNVENITYIVKSGDNLSKIAKQYGITWQELYSQNKDVIGDNPNIIYSGQKLLIPNTLESVILYTVKSGDNLSKIAKQYGITWQELYSQNKDIIGDNPNIIYSGQVLKIKA